MGHTELRNETDDGVLQSSSSGRSPEFALSTRHSPGPLRALIERFTGVNNGQR
jgi:hypothetical protein